MQQLQLNKITVATHVCSISLVASILHPWVFSEGLSLLPPEKVRGACDRFLVPSADQGNVRDGPVRVERWHLLLEHLPDHGLAADPVENGRERGDVALRPLLEQLPQSALLWVPPESDQERVHLTRC